MNTGIDRIRQLAEPVAAELGLEVLDVELHGHAPRQVLRIYLDSESDERPVTIGDCETVSRRMGDVLDAHEVLAGRYMLEVSSPGLDRPLKKPTHFARAVGKKVRVRLRREQQGTRNLNGRLESFDGGRLVIVAEDGKSWLVGLDDVERANLRYEFESSSERRQKGQRVRSQ